MTPLVQIVEEFMHELFIDDDAVGATDRLCKLLNQGGHYLITKDELDSAIASIDGGRDKDNIDDRLKTIRDGGN